MPKKKAQVTDKVLHELRAFGLAYPGAHYKSPWPGHMDLAVKDKTFAYLSLEGEPLGIGCKLPRTAHVALMLPFCKPAAYGLGKSGWVSAQFGPGDAIDVDMLKQWLDESYRAQAPKKLVKELDAGGASASAIDAASKVGARVNQRKAVAKRTGGGTKTKRAANKRVS
ncbi:MAG TPA: MmcQ/YjbR family DNA-binding protein [Kofleriaceae bacterium]